MYFTYQLTAHNQMVYFIKGACMQHVVACIRQHTCRHAHLRHTCRCAHVQHTCRRAHVHTYRHMCSSVRVELFSIIHSGEEGHIAETEVSLFSKHSVTKKVFFSSGAAVFFTLLRTIVTVAGFAVVGDGHWQRLLACLLGFVIARFVVTWLAGLPARHHDAAAKEAGHSP